MTDGAGNNDVLTRDHELCQPEQAKDVVDPHVLPKETLEIIHALAGDLLRS